MTGILAFLGTLILILLLVAGASLVGAYPTMWLMNYLITPHTMFAIFGITQFTFWKALWLNFLCSGLFKSHVSSSKK